MSCKHVIHLDYLTSTVDASTPVLERSSDQRGSQENKACSCNNRRKHATQNPGWDERDEDLVEAAH